VANVNAGPDAALGRRDDVLAVKDNIATLEGFTTCASKILINHHSPFQASVVDQLQNVEAKSIGKTNLDEFGMGSHSLHSHFGAVKNQWPYKGRSAGGSSGGSAVAVASGVASVGLGTDTGGSVRLPAAYTGTVGFKPSYGLVSRHGVVPYANSLDTVGIIADETASILETFHKVNIYDPKDPTSLPQPSRERAAEQIAVRGQETTSREHGDNLIFSNVKIGVPKEYNIAELDGGIKQAWNDALTILQSNGATIIPISLPNTRHALSAYYILAPAEAASNLAKYDGVRYGYRSPDLWDGHGDVLFSSTRGEGFGEEVKKRILLGSYSLSSEAIDNYFIKAQKVRRLVQEDFDRVFALPNPLRDTAQFDLSDMDETILLDNKLGPPQVDFIISPTAPTPPPYFNAIKEQSSIDSYMNDVFTVPASLAGIPAISVPFPCLRARHQVAPDAGFAGIQIMSQYSDDLRLISMAKKFEQLIADLLEDIEVEKARIVRYYEAHTPLDGISKDPSLPLLSPIQHDQSPVPKFWRHATRKGSGITNKERVSQQSQSEVTGYNDRPRDKRHNSRELQEQLEQSLDASLGLWESLRNPERSDSDQR
jgi:aspartyl-tRNA(Asn)/glutamyl-tRNA(Gln) amidotransferase subunit A